MNTFEIRPASRQAVKPIIAFYSESGCGKTYSSLLLARGMAGPKGKIVLIDSESGRGSLYADVLPGGYDTLALTDPFMPKRYIEAMEAVEQSGAAVGIIDSGSHEWEGISGVLDMAAENEQRSGKAGLNNWKTPKMEHAKWVLKLLQSPLPWIICLRAKFKSRQLKENGKTVIVKDEQPSPIQAEDFIFEATCHALIYPDHSIKLTKWSHPSLRDCFPDTGPITSEHGAKISQWCNSAGEPAKAQSTKSATVELATKLWNVCKPIRTPNVKEWNEVQQWLADNNITRKLVKELSREELSEVIVKSEIIIREMNENAPN